MTKPIGPKKSNNTLPASATRGGMTLEEVGAALNITRERARQLEATALRKLRARLGAKGIRANDILPDDWETRDRTTNDPY